MGSSIFWYDFETTGTVPSRDRPMQVAGLRTDLELQEIAPPLNLYCRLSDDILPHPAACLVTGISPQRLQAEGLTEADFMGQLHQQLMVRQTCVAGYNSLRFDDEVMRYSLYRNFFDPYTREWQGDNSRWDLIDLVRSAYAMRPDGIHWPQGEGGQVSLKLELLTQANGLEHGHAHDALSDVRATIALARLLRARQGRLYDYYFSLRDKAQVLAKVALLKPMVHVSGRYGAQRHYLSVVLPLAWHPINKNALVVCDLQGDIDPLFEESTQTLQQRLYTRRDQLPEAVVPVPLKLIHINKVPMVAPLGVLREADCQRLAIDLAYCQAQAQRLRDSSAKWLNKVMEIYGTPWPAPSDPEEQLYQGFLSQEDKRLCEQIRNLPADKLAGNWPFTDARLPELLFRYRARNYPDSLTDEERQRWRGFCRQRLSLPEYAAPQTLEHFFAELNNLSAGLGDEQRQLLGQWAQYATELAGRYQCKPLAQAPSA